LKNEKRAEKERAVAVRSKAKADAREEKKAKKAEKKKIKSESASLPARSTSWRSINGTVRSPSISTPEGTNVGAPGWAATSSRKAQL
jgi:hypothetical protein